MIVGKVGSGKSSLVSAILGEMPRTSGVLEVNGQVAYVSQDTWIRNATLRDNILFEQEYDAERYERVLDASQLAMDLKALPNGDSTEIGERGINLSGGQKARVAIARAMYRSGTDVLILDDPLSAVDPHVAHAIFDKCIVGLAGGQTRLLVLNSHYDLLSSADFVVVLDRGKVAAQGTYIEVLDQFPSLVDTATVAECDAFQTEWLDKEAVSAVPSIGEDEAERMNELELTGHLILDEDRVKGTVGSHVYKAYFDETGMNGWLIVLVISLLYAVGQGARTIVDWWPGHWAHNMPRRGEDPTYSGTTYGMWYLGFIVLCSILTLIRGVTMIESCMRSSQHMHDELFRRVLHAPVTRYFDVTPIGQILNRFSNDLDQMDTMLPQEYQLLLQNVSLALGALAVSAFASYWIALTYVPIFLVFLYIGQYFKRSSSEIKRLERSSSEIKRLEGVTRTPVYNLFSETLSGLSTIRAFRMEDSFVKQNRRVVDANSNLYFTYWSASRWLETQLDFLSVAIIFVATLYLVATAGRLAYRLHTRAMVQWVMRSVDRTNNAMTTGSVERLLFFSQIESEDESGKTVDELIQNERTSTDVAPLSWPSRWTRVVWQRSGRRRNCWCGRNRCSQHWPKIDKQVSTMQDCDNVVLG